MRANDRHQVAGVCLVVGVGVVCKRKWLGLFCLVYNGWRDAIRILCQEQKWEIFYDPSKLCRQNMCLLFICIHMIEILSLLNRGQYVYQVK